MYNPGRVYTEQLNAELSRHFQADCRTGKYSLLALPLFGVLLRGVAAGGLALGNA
nr:hypothetical protein [Tawny frogmouth aviadenovirus A]